MKYLASTLIEFVGVKPPNPANYPDEGGFTASDGSGLVVGAGVGVGGATGTGSSVVSFAWGSGSGSRIVGVGSGMVIKGLTKLGWTKAV